MSRNQDSVAQGVSISQRINNAREHLHNCLDEMDEIAEIFIGEGGSPEEINFSLDEERNQRRNEARNQRSKGRIKKDGSEDLRFKDAQVRAGQRSE